MKNTLVFLHGKGADKTSHPDFMKKLASKYDADLYSFNAPYHHKSGYSWFDKKTADGKRCVDMDKFTASLNLISEKISSLKMNPENIIVCGHSQGGVMALAIGLKLPFKKVISICGDWSEDVDCIAENAAKEFVWIEGGKDSFLSDERKLSYKTLLKRGINLQYSVDLNTEHDVFSRELLENL